MLFAVASAELEADPLLFFVIVEAASSASLLSLLLLLLLLPLLELPASKEGKRLYVLPEHHCEILFSALNPPFASCSFPLPLVIIVCLLSHLGPSRFRSLSCTLPLVLLIITLVFSYGAEGGAPVGGTTVSQRRPREDARAVNQT